MAEARLPRTPLLPPDVWKRNRDRKALAVVAAGKVLPLNTQEIRKIMEAR